jgi:PAS domain S-box-containing protein
LEVGVAHNPEAFSGDPVERLFELSLDMLGTASSDGYFSRLNPAWERTLGWTNEQLMAEPVISFVHPDDIEATTALAATLAQPGGPSVIEFENRYRTSGGDYRWIQWSTVADRGVLHFVAKDITERRAAEILRDQTASLMGAIIESVADGLYVADSNGILTFINPAGVRLLGYESDDELLGHGPHATFHHCRWEGTRQGIGDCPLSTVRTSGRSAHVDEDIFWRKDGSELPVAYSSAAIDLDGGTGSVVAFHDITALQTERERLRALVGDAAWFEEVRGALAGDRFVLYGQPIVDMETGAIVKHELLLRMLSPTGEVIAPGLFLPAAEKYGLIDDIDRWVITQAVEMATTGRHLSVNLSADSVGRAEILLHIEQELTRTGADPELLTFEVTETAVMEDLQDGRRFADRLVDLGCSFSLDDFGTGYGSLTYLRQLPIDYLKIDTQFVRQMARSEPDQKLVKTIVTIAQDLGKRTVAEGVEDEETMGMLREFGVDFAQGYHLGRPMPLPVLNAGPTLTKCA